MRTRRWAWQCTRRRGRRQRCYLRLRCNSLLGWARWKLLPRRTRDSRAGCKVLVRVRMERARGKLTAQLGAPPHHCAFTTVAAPSTEASVVFIVTVDGEGIVPYTRGCAYWLDQRI